MRARRPLLASGAAVTGVSASCSGKWACQVISTAVKPATAFPGTAGGTLPMVDPIPAHTWDRLRLSAGADMALAGRVLRRTLTAWAPATLPDPGPDPGTDTAPAFVEGAGVIDHVDSQVLCGTVDLARVSVR
jgi:hypothetical protein